ncbi:endonuclease/exonuclease/phosphatase family protein [Anoxybacter fermentans]|uniref:endonuclease/exonuclease/phosphatase family protein n=1 Tax=Anoxybacter fermentans TaxID=1323375 RepID=UPI000F8EB3DA|nr:endonuclease/exonuclease/phosphatase family protein [Anoxybacter fermentans]
MTQLRVMTFNIHHGEGMDGLVDLNRIAKVIKEANVDLVGLNEVDVRNFRSGMVNQIGFLGKKTEMNAFFAPTLWFGIGHYGNGVLARFPILNPKEEELPGFRGREVRGVFQFTIRLKNRNVQIIVTHLGLNPVERQRQLEFLTLKIQKIKEPLIVLGDFNTTPTAPVMQKFLKDTGLMVHSYKPTFPAHNPELKVDYILTSKEWEVVKEVTPIQGLASDHLPVVGTFKLK